MSKPLIAAAAKIRADDAAKLMFEKKIKKLPVVENGRLRGLVTLTDILSFQEVLSFLNGLSAKDMPKRLKKTVELYFDHAKHFRRRCSIMVKDGFSTSCQEKKCMWWLGDECAVTKLCRQLSNTVSVAEAQSFSQ